MVFASISEHASSDVFSYGLRFEVLFFSCSGSLHVRMCFFGCISLARVFILRVAGFSLSSYRSFSTSWRWILQLICPIVSIRLMVL